LDSIERHAIDLAVSEPPPVDPDELDASGPHDVAALALHQLDVAATCSHHEPESQADHTLSPVLSHVHRHLFPPRTALRDARKDRRRCDEGFSTEKVDCS